MINKKYLLKFANCLEWLAKYDFKIEIYNNNENYSNVIFNFYYLDDIYNALIYANDNNITYSRQYTSYNKRAMTHAIKIATIFNNLKDNKQNLNIMLKLLNYFNEKLEKIYQAKFNYNEQINYYNNIVNF